MKTAFVRTTYIAFASATLLLAACGDSSSDVGSDKLGAIEAGAPKAAVLEAMGQGPLTAEGTDTLKVERGFRRNIYLVNGTQYEVLFYRELAGNVAEPVEQVKETPVVLKDGKVLGWGWKYYVKTAMEELKLPTPLSAKLDANTPGVNPGALPQTVTPPSDSAGAPTPAADTSKKSGA